IPVASSSARTQTNRTSSSFVAFEVCCCSFRYVGLRSCAIPISPRLRRPLVRDISFRRITHYPRQRHFFLLRKLFKRFVEIRRKTDCRAHLRSAWGFHLLSISLFHLLIV